MTLKLDGWIRKAICTSSMLWQALSTISNPSVNSNWRFSLEMLNLDKNWPVFVPCDLDGWPWETIWHPLLCYFKLCGHRPIQVRVLQSGNAQVGWKICDFLSHVTLKFDKWPEKNNRSPLLLPLQALLIISQPSMNSSSSYNPETPNLGQNRWILVLCDPWNLMDGPWKTIEHLCIISQPSTNSNSSYSPETPQFGSKSVIFCPMWPWNLTDDI